jgi:prophage regulatory protein
MLNLRLKPLIMIRLRDVINRTGLSRSTIYNKLDIKSPHYDDLFPKQVRVGSGSVRWIESEIDFWIESCIASSREQSILGDIGCML